MSEVLRFLDAADARPTARRALATWLTLQSALALRPVEAARSLRATRDPARTLRQLAPRAGPPPALGGWIEVLRRTDVRGLPLLSPAYPARLARLEDAAPLLFLRGRAEALEAPAVAIVGARAATAYGRAVARELARGLARSGVVVVSGLARGVDAEAHRGALEAGGRTLAVQACGPDRVYPPEHRQLAAQIAERGAVLSELPVGTPPRSPYFPLRNRLISGLASAVVVVEARRRSGSLITARHALDQGIDVLAVPGPIHAPTSEGPNRLLREGAAPLLELADVFEALGLPPPPAPAASVPSAARTERERAILAALTDRPSTRDELGRRLRRAPGELAADLMPLELEGAVVEERDGRLCIASPPSRRGL